MNLFNCKIWIKLASMTDEFCIVKNTNFDISFLNHTTEIERAQRGFPWELSIQFFNQMPSRLLSLVLYQERQNPALYQTEQ